MLKQRVITALILAPLVIWGVFSLPAFYFSLFILFIVALASWEWGHLSGISGKLPLGVYTVASLCALSLLLWFADIQQNQFYILLTISVIWWLNRVVRIINYKAKAEAAVALEQGINIPVAMSILVSIIIPFYSLIYLRNEYSLHGYLFYLLLLIWGADIFAYFAGKHFGKRKLAPHVSPGKTWEGAYGAMAGTLVCSVSGSYIFEFPINDAIIFFVLSLVVVVISIFGDLSESLYKRQSGVKDSGNILPGHGGILDRVDSLIAAAPFYIIGLLISGLLP